MMVTKIKKIVFTIALLALFSFNNNDFEQIGMASYYANRFHGEKTSSGELYDKNKFTAAHRTLPFGTLVKVTNLKTGTSVIVKVNDRGPYSHGRLIDLSYSAALKIGLIQSGVTKVKIILYENSTEDEEFFPFDSTDTDLISDSILYIHDSIVKSDNAIKKRRRYF